MQLHKITEEKLFRLDCVILYAVERASLITDCSGKPLCSYFYCRYLTVVTVIRLLVEPTHRQYSENSSLFQLEEFVKWDGFYESSVDQLLWQSTHELFIPHWELYTLMSHFNVQRISKPHCGVALWWSTSFCIVHISLNALFYVPINCLCCKSTARLYDLARCAVTQVSFFLLIKLMNIMVPSCIYIIQRKCINKMFVAV